MYSSLDTIDLIVGDGDGDGKPIDVVLTDHRTRAEIEAEPEVSVLFAMARAIMGKRAMEARGSVVNAVVCIAQHEVPTFLVDALGSVGARVEYSPGRRAGALPSKVEPPDVVVERAFAGLAMRVARRTGLTDPAAVLHALEAETLASPPTRKDDEVGYWTRVVELMAVVIAVVRTQRAGTWVIADKSEVPFGFLIAPSATMLPCNRALRFIEDGADESMFRVLASLDEVTTSDAGRPILPSLRDKADADASGILCRPLADAASDEMPVIAYGRDGEITFSLLLRAHEAARADEIHGEALANIAGQTVELDDQDFEGQRVIVVCNSWFAAEKLLDVEFMRALHLELDANALVVGVPRRGLMAVAAESGLAALRTLVDREFEAGGGRRISAALLLVRDGRVVGLAGAAEPRDPDQPPTSAKPGFFSRLFGRKR